MNEGYVYNVCYVHLKVQRAAGEQGLARVVPREEGRSVQRDQDFAEGAASGLERGTSNATLYYDYESKVKRGKGDGTRHLCTQRGVFFRNKLQLRVCVCVYSKTKEIPT